MLLRFGPQSRRKRQETTHRLKSRTCARKKPPKVPLTILNLPDEMLAHVLEFYCVPDIFDESTVLAPSATWRKVCQRFRHVYDTFGFLQRTQVTIQSPEALAAFITPDPFGRRSVDLAWHRITLSKALLETLLCQPQTGLSFTHIGEAMEPHQQRQGLLHLELPTPLPPSPANIVRFTALPSTSLRLERADFKKAEFDFLQFWQDAFLHTPHTARRVNP